MTHDPDARMPPTAGTLVTPVAFHILLALATGERHGYAIMDATALSAGTVYRMIKRLVVAGLVTPVTRPTVTSDDERRRYYRLTLRGRAAAQAEARRLMRLVGHARAVLLTTGDGVTMGDGACACDDDRDTPSPTATHRSLP